MPYKFIGFSIALSLLISSLLSSCAPSRIEADNRTQKLDAAITPFDNSIDESTLPPVVEPELVSTSEDYEKLSAETAVEYQKQPEIIKNGKNGENKVYVGYSRLRNVKSSYNRETLELEVYGIAEVLKADQKTALKSENFHLKGKYKIKTGKISLKPVETIITQNTSGLKVRAEVICLKEETSTKFNCDRAIVDVFIKDGDNYYTEQLTAGSLDKPTVIGGKNKKPKVSEKPTFTEEPKSEEPKVTTEISPVATAPTTAVAPEAATEQVQETQDAEVVGTAEEVEGHDGSIDDRYVGLAPTADLKQLFSDEQDASDKENDNDDQTEVEQIITEVAGRLILRDQVAGNGSPENGRLRNASYLKTHIESYNLVNQIVMASPKLQNYYGTQEMMDILEAMGKKMQMIQNNKIYVSRISAKHGGPLPPSVSHQIGMDVDLGYPTNSGKIAFPKVASNGSLRSSDFSPAKTLELFKFLMTQQVTPVDRIFVDQSIINILCREARNTARTADRAIYMKLFENIQHVSGHGDHFHLRLRCTANQPGCRLKKYKKMPTCI